MSVTVFAVISWLVLTAFFYMKKKLSFLQNVVVFMATEIVITSVWTILTLNLSLIHYKEKSLPFVAFLMKREFVLPVIVLLFVNAFLLARGKIHKTLCFVIAVFGMFTSDLICKEIGLVNYNDWELWHMMFVDAGYLLSGLLFATLLVRYQKWVFSNHESDL